VLATWTSLLGPELGRRVARAKGLASLLAFVALVLLGMAFVLGADGAFLTPTLVIVAVLLVAYAVPLLFLTLRSVGGEIARRLAAQGRPVPRPSLVLRSQFERWRAANGIDAAVLAHL
jgi:hypothetical protein